MPRIFDNISEKLLTALQNTMQSADRADFCVGYFNLRGWRLLRADIDQLSGGEQGCCRILIGMNPTPRDELREYLSLKARKPECWINSRFCGANEKIVEGLPPSTDLWYAAHQAMRMSKVFRDLVQQLTLRQSRGEVVSCSYSLHAKLYLIHKQDYNTPTLAFLGSSNLTLAGLSEQGELNTEVTD